MPNCSYHEGGRQCPYDGRGNPPLCNAHKVLLDQTTTKRSAFADLVSKVVSGKRVTQRDLGNMVGDIIGDRSVEDFIRSRGMNPSEVAEAWRRAVGADRRSPRPRARKQHPQEPKQWPNPPPPDPRIEKERWARKVMEFDKEFILLRGDEGRREIKKRHRELARKYHPDKKGGSTKKMQDINQAVDILLALVDN